MRSVVYCDFLRKRAAVADVVQVVVLGVCHEADGFNLLHRTSKIPSREKESLNSTS